MRKHTTALPFTDVPVAHGNFDHRPHQRTAIDTIVLHSMAGFVAGTRATFGRYVASDPSSAHYGIGMDGKIDWYVDEDLVAYHATNYAVNQRSIGIEHEDFAKHLEPRSDALYETSSKLVADICKFYSIPCDKHHIIAHNQVPHPRYPERTVATACPGTLDIERIINGAKRILEVTSPPVGGIPQPANEVSPVGSYPVTEHQYRAALVLTDAIKRPDITTLDGRAYGNEEGMARDFVDNWPKYIKMNIQTVQSRGLLERLSKLFGLTN